MISRPPFRLVWDGTRRHLRALLGGTARELGWKHRSYKKLYSINQDPEWLELEELVSKYRAGATITIWIYLPEEEGWREILETIQLRLLVD